MVLVYPQIVTGADLLRGIIKLDQLAPILQRRGAKSVGIVNSKMYGVRSFCKVMEKYGIHPVIGLSIRLELDDGSDLLLYAYAKDDRGYSNLLKMSSAISTREPETLAVEMAASIQRRMCCHLPDDRPLHGMITIELKRSKQSRMLVRRYILVFPDRAV